MGCLLKCVIRFRIIFLVFIDMVYQIHFQAHILHKLFLG